MAHSSIAQVWRAAWLTMGPLIAAVLRHVDLQPDHLAIVFNETHLSYADLAREIGRRMQTLVTADPNAITVKSDANMPNKILDALARLGLDFPIVGATSGSTGSAKSYVRTHASWINSFLLEQKCFAINADDCILAHGNPSHSLFFYAICNALYAGATVSCASGFRPDDLLAKAAELRPTVLYAVPTQLEMIVRHSQGITLPSVRLVLSSGARLLAANVDHIQRIFPNAAIIDFYGASETSFIALANHSSDPHLPADSVGKPFPGVALLIESQGVLPKDLPVAHDSQTEVGRIWVHSEMLFDRYLSEMPTSFEEKTDQDGRRWVTVGDLGRMDSNGYVFLAGRTDRTINVSGVKIQPEEIEAALLAHPAVVNAAVIGLPDGLRGQRLVAAVKTQSPVNTSEFIAFLRGKIDDYKIPRDYVAIAQWPMNSSGKTDFSAIRERSASADIERL